MSVFMKSKINKNATHFMHLFSFSLDYFVIISVLVMKGLKQHTHILSIILTLGSTMIKASILAMIYFKYAFIFKVKL